MTDELPEGWAGVKIGQTGANKPRYAVLRISRAINDGLFDELRPLRRECMPQTFLQRISREKKSNRFNDGFSDRQRESAECQ
jgi:hypothetical protein